MIDDIRKRAEGVGWVVDESTNGKLLIVTDAPVSMDFPANFIERWKSSDTSHVLLTIKQNKHGHQAALDLIEAEERRQMCPDHYCQGTGVTKAWGGWVTCPDCKGTGKRKDYADVPRT
jgi:DnaJ-class molecular chaperone